MQGVSIFCLRTVAKVVQIWGGVGMVGVELGWLGSSWDGRG